MSEAQAWETNVLRNLQLSLEGHGMKVHINPSRDIIPSFLGNHRPDAIAIDPKGGGIIIEVKRDRRPAAEQQLATLSKMVSANKGWEFRVYYINPNTDQPSSIAKPTLEQVDGKLQEIKALTDSGHYAPALIYGWSVLEALARLAGGPKRSGGLSPIQAVQELAAEGYIENDKARRLRDMVRLRSSVVHGDFSANVDAEQVAFLVKQLETMRNYIAKVEAENANQ